ncbi:penicillin acylase family protein [Planctobacterium marinum]|uniref:penicillin acylase family protein n=1 Tax=Planctobacterium marinum TaxID=1631968 RepID=UPI001E38ACEB|nr:penicillin acylase family protein [Planctobacterium marinum]MCC2606938.1 penicillin acylase family protein [Planctobacterium marinum]
MEGIATIKRDDKGVPVILAKHEKDIYFSMGYVHAQDRLWQLEIQKRIAKGTLSEVFGAQSVNQDIWMRTLNLYKAADKVTKILSEEALNSLQAYSAGINQWLEENHDLPVEFRLLNITPEPWTPVDSLAWSKVFALNLSGNLKTELDVQVAAQYVSDDLMQVLFPNHPSTQQLARSSTISSFEELARTQSSLIEDLKIGGKNVGSNVWVIGGQHTDNGFPILANDPHLGLQIPSLWYAVAQQADSFQVKGMSLVGLPLVVFGQNNNIAWGGANMMADVQDLIVEETNPRVYGQYRYQGKWLEMNERVEYIKVKPDFPASFRAELKPVKILIRETRNGPVVSDAIPGSDSVLSLKWTAHSSNDTTYESLYRINKASNWDEFRAAAKQFVAPPLNLLYADTDNNIGFQAVGRIPLRKSNSWSGFIPFDEMPRISNPPSGYIINANNNMASDEYPYYISSDFAAPHRANRIEQMIEARTHQQQKLKISDVQVMQTDVLDLSALALLKKLSDFKARSPEQREVIELLAKWQGNAASSEVGATLYYNWLRHIRKSMFSDELSGVWNKPNQANLLANLTGNISADQIASIITAEEKWCDDANTSVVETCDDTLSTSLDSAIRELTKILGNDIESWELGSLQSTIYSHLPFSNFKVLDTYFERQYESGGATHTVNVSVGRFVPSVGLESTFGAGFRQIINMHPDDRRHQYINSTGQSGQVSSPHYSDMFELFHNNQFLELSTQ